VITAPDSKEIRNFSNEGVRFISTEEEHKYFLQFLLNNEESKTKINDNYLNSNTKIDFSRQVLVVAYEAIIKNIYNSDFGYVIEFQNELRGYSDHFYPLIVTKNPKSELVFFLNKKLGPYLDTKIYPDYLNSMVDLFHNLNNNSANERQNEKIYSDMKKEVSGMLNSEQNSRKSTQQSFKCEVKFGKVIIVGSDEDDEGLISEKETTSQTDLLKKKRGVSKDAASKKVSNKKEGSSSRKKAKTSVNKKVKKCK